MIVIFLLNLSHHLNGLFRKKISKLLDFFCKVVNFLRAAGASNPRRVTRAGLIFHPFRAQLNGCLGGRHPRPAPRDHPAAEGCLAPSVAVRARLRARLRALRPRSPTLRALCRCVTLPRHMGLSALPLATPVSEGSEGSAS